ncbi:hypothetical protein DSM02_3667 [Leeuwenhoekiella polynyae]|uniref:Uncharacterized protein n=1 Tax=Leeuwenhoekiella polynyae TaxID=1550906 RepID=A0A4Q0NS67_9FLAO|nr:hypothetical protein DSM02_3667 [Leeuwenhoekiella polynyae]
MIIPIGLSIIQYLYNLLSILYVVHEFSVTENGTEISNGTYELIMKESIYSGKMERLIQFPENEQYLGFVKTGIINIYKNEKLNISDNNADGIGSEFVRIE